MPRAIPWLAVLDVDTGDVLGVPTSFVIGKLETLDPAPKDWVEPEGPMESFGFEDWPGWGSSTPIDQARLGLVTWQTSSGLPYQLLQEPSAPGSSPLAACRPAAKGAGCKSQRLHQHMACLG